MAKATLEAILEEMKTLTVEERQRLREELDKSLSPSNSQLTEDEFERKLLQVGLIASIPSRDVDPKLFHSYRPVKVTGKPLSEVILEERR